MMTASGNSAFTFSAAASASGASKTTWSAFPSSLSPTVNCIHKPPRLTPLRRPCEFLPAGTVPRRLAQRVDDFPIGCFGKSLQRARPDVSQHPQLQAETRRDSVVRSFEDHDHVKVTHGQVEGFDLATHFLESFLRSVQTAWRVLRLQDALLGPIC